MSGAQMLGYDQFDTSAEHFLGRIAKQHGRRMVPANDRARSVGTDDSISDLIENLLGQFGLPFHGCTLRLPAAQSDRWARFALPTLRPAIGVKADGRRSGGKV